MSPDRPPVELETPIETDLISPYYFSTAGASSETFAQRDCASSGYNGLVNHFHELPGDTVNPEGIAEMSTWRQTAIQDADALNVMRSENLSNDSELAYEAYIGDPRHSVAAGYAVAQPAMPAVPGFLSPQALSQKSSPASPETPGNGVSLSEYEHAVSDPMQIQGASLYQCDETRRPFSYSSTATIPGPSLYDSDASQHLSVLGLDLHSLNKALSADFTQTDVEEGQTYWSGELDSAFRPYPQQEEDLPGGNLTPEARPQVFNMIDEQDRLLSFLQMQPSLLSEITIPSYLLPRTRLSLQELQARTGTWQLGEDHVWAACDPSVSEPELEEAERESQNYALISPESGNSSMNNPGYLDTPQSEKIFTSRKMYRPAKCDHCKQQFNGQFAKGNLRRHVTQKHDPSGVRKVHRCSMCNKSFRRSDAKLLHERQMH
ncbi:hypothetical protein E8E13_000543 [Curvularia kusanoi]|uniref:C2H2-type domain-containing protein n=1 Tax=Curvularia kusanoi TaxID=90978 RepID=A0A9P4T746_CURKU|nr:hypothetical protein E8E13_000543 [Curvularia kusanoi]